MATINPIDSANPIQVAKGGTGAASYNANAPICAGTTSTGAFQDGGTNSANEFLVSNGAGALPTWKIIRGSGTGGKSPLSMWQSGNTGTAVTRWAAPFGSGSITTQANAQFIVPYAGTISKLYVNVSANTSTTNTTVTVNKNSSNSAVVATITALTTGIFSDATHSVSVAAGDLIQWELSAAASTKSWAGVISCLLTAS